jgi:hypothetical protein
MTLVTTTLNPVAAWRSRLPVPHLDIRLKMRGLSMIALFFLGGCDVSAPSSIPWKEGMVRDAKFTSLSETGILNLSFGSTGNIATGISGDRKTDVFREIYEWSIDGSGKLVLIEDGDYETVFLLISFESDLVEVWEEHRGLVKYRRTKN